MKLYQALILSILVHALFFLSLKASSLKFFKEADPPKLYVEFRQDNNAPLMSDKTNRVKKQTRTRETAPSNITSMNAEQQLSPSKESAEKSQDVGQKLRELSPSDNDIFFQAAPTVSEGLRQKLQSFLPPDLEIGDMVALNTDQNIYYSFYRRMAEKVIWPWAQHVTQGFERMKMAKQLGGTSKSWVTIIEVILDKNGNLVSTQPLQLAGESDMDQAPIRAFKSAKNFPNPPDEMVEEDGYIRIRYRFVVYYRPQVR